MRESDGTYIVQPAVCEQVVQVLDEATHGVTLIKRLAQLLQCVKVLEIVLGLVGGISDAAVKGPPGLHVRTVCNTNIHAQCKGTRPTVHLSLSVQPCNFNCIQ